MVRTGRLLLAAAALIAAALPRQASAAVAKVSRPGVYAGYAPELYRQWKRSAIYVPVRDGTRLAITIYRPARNGAAVDTPYPVLVAFTPYHARTYTPDGKVASTVEQNSRGRPMVELTRYGYVVVSVDIRGKGASFGSRRGFQDRTEAMDSRDMVEWLARQPWSNGKVATWGCSYVGGSQYQVASTRPPHLKAIFPGCADFDKYSFVSRGGIVAQFNTRTEDPVADDSPTVPMDEDKDGAMLKAAVAQHAANSPMGPIWFGMPNRDSVSTLLGDDYWREASPSTYAEAIRRSGIAIYKWGNWKDEGGGQVLLADENLSNPGKLMIGGWGHCDPGTFDLFAEHLRFYDHYLKGVDNGIEREPHIYYYTIGAPKGREWRFADRWPLPQTRRRNLYLGEGAGLGAGPSPSGADRYAVDYSVSCPTFPMLWPCVLDAKGLTYTTAPLRADIQVTGAPILHLWVKSSTPDADVFAYLEDVAPDGSVDIVVHGRLRLSHRRLTPAAFRTGGLPWHNGEAKDLSPMVPGQAEALVMDLLPTSKIFKAGHRLRLTVTGADPRQRNLEQVRISPPPVIEVLRGGTRASYLDLPVIPPGRGAVL